MTDMERICAQMELRLPDLAEGKADAEASAHLASCQGCAQKLEQLKTMLHAATVPVLNAPSDVLARAKALVAGKRRVFTARLFGSSLSLAGARSAATDLQLMLGTEEQKLRLMYTRLPGDKWEITGRAPGADWEVQRGSSRFPCDSFGGFVVQAPSLEQSDFTLVHGEEQIHIPSAQELLGGESG